MQESSSPANSTPTAVYLRGDDCWLFFMLEQKWSGTALPKYRHLVPPGLSAGGWQMQHKVLTLLEQ